MSDHCINKLVNISTVITDIIRIIIIFWYFLKTVFNFSSDKVTNNITAQITYGTISILITSDHYSCPPNKDRKYWLNLRPIV